MDVAIPMKIAATATPRQVRAVTTARRLHRTTQVSIPSMSAVRE